MAARWTNKEIDYLKRNWGTKKVEFIAKKLDRKPGGVRSKARRLGLCVRNGTTKEEELPFLVWYFEPVIRRIRRIDDKLMRKLVPLAQLLAVVATLLLVISNLWLVQLQSEATEVNKRLVDIVELSAVPRDATLEVRQMDRAFDQYLLSLKDGVAALEICVHNMGRASTGPINGELNIVANERFKYGDLVVGELSYYIPNLNSGEADCPDIKLIFTECREVSCINESILSALPSGNVVLNLTTECKHCSPRTISQEVPICIWNKENPDECKH